VLNLRVIVIRTRSHSRKINLKHSPSKKERQSKKVKKRGREVVKRVVVTTKEKIKGRPLID